MHEESNLQAELRADLSSAVSSGSVRGVRWIKDGDGARCPLLIAHVLVRVNVMFARVFAETV